MNKTLEILKDEYLEPGCSLLEDFMDACADAYENLTYYNTLTEYARTHGIETVSKLAQVAVDKYGWDTPLMRHALLEFLERLKK